MKGGHQPLALGPYTPEGRNRPRNTLPRRPWWRAIEAGEVQLRNHVPHGDRGHNDIPWHCLVRMRLLIDSSGGRVLALGA